MTTQTDLKTLCHERATALEHALAAYDPATATAHPGHWSAREILSHIMGPRGNPFNAQLKKALEEEAPTFDDIHPGDTYYGGTRPGMSFEALCEEAEAVYRGLESGLAACTDEQLQRPVKVPFLAEFGVPETQTVESWFRIVVDQHLGEHIESLKAFAPAH